MDKHKFFNKLHKKLGKKYGLSPTSIEYLRVHSITLNHSIKDICFHLARKSKLSDEKLKILSFLASCKVDDWLDITAYSEFDKTCK